MIRQNLNFSQFSRSPTPLLRGNLRNNESIKAYVKLRNLSKKSYVKLKKLKIFDTSLTFIHKVKDPSSLQKMKNKEIESPKASESKPSPTVNEIFDKVIPMNDIKIIIEKLVNKRARFKCSPILDQKTGIVKLNSTNLPKISEKCKEFKPKVGSIYRNSYKIRKRNIKSRGIQVENDEICAWENEMTNND